MFARRDPRRRVWSYKKALRALARAFGGRAYLGGAGQKDRKNPEKFEKVKKNPFFSNT